MLKESFEKYKIYQLLAIFIVCQPVIDFLTSLMVRYVAFPLTIGIVVRALFVVAMFLYVMWYVPKEKKKMSILITIATILYGIVFLLVHYQGLSSIFVNFRGLFKTFYFPLLLVYFMELSQYDDYRLDHKYFFYCAMIYIIVIILADITHTNFYSYQYEKLGHVGWFYAANEIGAILAILSPAAINYILKQKPIFISIPFVIIYAYVVLIVGTKVPYLGFMGSLVALLIAYIVNRNWKYVLSLGCCALLSLALFPGSNLAQNMNIHISSLFPQGEETGPAMSEEEKITNLVLSSRDLYLAQNLRMFHDSSLSHHVMGIGYLDQGEELKVVEIDYADIYICNGYLGMLIVLVAFGYACIIIVQKLLSQQLLKFVFQSKFFSMSIGAVLGLGIAAMAGHVLTAPAVSLYLVLYASQMSITIRPNDLIQDK